ALPISHSGLDYDVGVGGEIEPSETSVSALAIGADPVRWDVVVDSAALGKLLETYLQVDRKPVWPTLLPIGVHDDKRRIEKLIVWNVTASLCLVERYAHEPDLYEIGK